MSTLLSGEQTRGRMGLVLFDAWGCSPRVILLFHTSSWRHPSLLLSGLIHTQTNWVFKAH